MKIRFLSFAALLLLLGCFSAQAQLNTVVLPGTSATNVTFTLSGNHAFEILTIAVDPSVVVEFDNGTDTVTFGQGRLEFPYPFVFAGPGTVSLKKTSTGGDGGMVTYRLTGKNGSSP
jgi:hypothetical protein